MAASLAIVGQLLHAVAHQLGVEAQKARLAPLPLHLLEGEQRIAERQGAAQSAADAVEGLRQPISVLIGGDPVLLRHPSEGQRQPIRQAVCIHQQVPVTLLQETGQGLVMKLRPVQAEPVVVEHVHQDTAKAAPGGLEAGHRRPVFGVTVGEGIYLAVQPDPLVEFGAERARQGALDEIPQQVAGEGTVGMGCQMQVSQIVHEG